MARSPALWVTGVTKRKWILLILELQLIKEKQGHTHTGTPDKEESMLEVVVHGALKTLVTDMFLNIKLNLFLMLHDDLLHTGAV